MFIHRFCVGVVFAVFLLGVEICAQEARVFRQESASTCEHLKNILDYALIEHNKTKVQYMIFVFRPGRSESSTKFSRARPSTIERYLKTRDSDLSRFIIAQGKPTSDLGKLEIYLLGELREEIYFRRNKAGNDQCIE